MARFFALDRFRRLRASLVTVKGLAIVFLTAGLLTAGAARLLALPKYETNNNYYNEFDEWVASDGITCNGAHWSEGDKSLAQPGNGTTEKSVCSAGTFPDYVYCSYWIDSNGNRFGESCFQF
jgi:hypothetical protein